MSEITEELFLGVMDIQEAKNHQHKLKNKGILLELKSNGETCTTGCKVTVELWGHEKDTIQLQEYFQNDFKKHIAGHTLNLEHLAEVFDPSLEFVCCQACGAKFKPTASECPDCGLCY